MTNVLPSCQRICLAALSGSAIASASYEPTSTDNALVVMPLPRTLTRHRIPHEFVDAEQKGHCMVCGTTTIKPLVSHERLGAQNCKEDRKIRPYGCWSFHHCEPRARLAALSPLRQLLILKTTLSESRYPVLSPNAVTTDGINDTLDLAVMLVIVIAAHCSRFDRRDVDVTHGTEEFDALVGSRKAASTRIASILESDDS